MRAKKTLVANILIFLVLLAGNAAKAEEENSDHKATETPNTIPADSVGGESAEGDDQQNGSEEDDGEQCHFWGNSYSLKFHLKSCPFAQAMNPRHVQFLKSVKEALKLGEKPCRYCLPPYTLEVSCKLLAPSVHDHQSDNSAERKAPENGI